MSKKTKMYLAVIVCAAVLFFIFRPLPYLSLLQQVEDHAALSSRETSSLEIESVDADIVILPSESPQAEFELSGRSNRRLFLELQQEGTHAKIKTAQRTPSWLTWGTRSRDLTLSVFLPKDFADNIEISNVSGMVKMEEQHIPHLEVKSISGNILLSGIQSRTAKLHSVSGSVSMHGESSGDYTIKTTSGNIDFAAPSGALQITSVSGSVRALLTHISDLIQISSVSGSVDLTMPEHSNASVSLSTISGSVTSSLSLEGVSSSQRTLTGTLGEGTHQITIRTTSGSIKLQH